MKIQTISACKACKGQKNTQEVRPPKHFCITCSKLSSDNNCQVFDRYVEPAFNRCFYHSQYQPMIIVFKPVKDLDLIISQGQSIA